MRSILAIPLFLLLIACNGSDSDAVADKLQLARKQSASADREWRHYLGDKASSQYSPLKEINRDNVHRLKLAWRYDATGGDEGLQGETQHNPLIVKGVLYGVAAHAQRLFALNAVTGKEIWAWTPPESSSQVSRGLVYWSDESEAQERLFFASGSWIYALNPRTGQTIEAFGEEGRINLGDHLTDEPIESEFLAATTPGVIYKDLLIQGMRVNEFSGAAPGHIRAYDVRTGAMKWRFNTIPQEGEFGADTWPADALKTAGGANSWAGMAVDEARGLVFIPTGSAAFDFYGADRKGDNLFANSLIALDAATGERRWHYQMIRHDLWDRDLPSPPNLVTIEKDGRSIDAVVQATKTGHLFVFNRETGEPLFPIREEPVHGQALPGEFPARSQPLPVLPEPFTVQGLSVDGLAQRTPEVLANATNRLSGHLNDGLFNVPSLQGSILKPGFDGGAEWGGSAWDETQGLLYINANEIASVVQMVPTKGTTLMSAMNTAMVYRMSCGQCHGADRSGGGVVPSLRGIGSRMPPWEMYKIIKDGRGRMPAIDTRMGSLGAVAVMWHLYTAGDDDAVAVEDVTLTSYANTGYPDFVSFDNLPASAPPWGTLTAVHLASGKIGWRIPLGDFPQALERGISGHGAINYGGPVATAGGLLFIAATPDRIFRALNSANGKPLWEAELPTAGFATPAIYEAGNKQYVVISASGTKLGSPPGRYYLAYTLDD